MRTKFTIKRASVVAITAVVALLAGGPAPTAQARPAPIKTLVGGLAGPLQLDVFWGQVLVGQSFSGTISTVDHQGRVRDLAHDTGVDGVARGPRWSVLFTHTDFDRADAQGVAESELRRRNHDGSISIVADLRAYEEAHNPDAANTYGFQGLTPDCLASLPPEPSLPPNRGSLDSHPYALAVSRGTTYVAEAGGNDILAVDPNGAIRTVAVLPPTPVTISAGAASALELPPCVAGATFNFEPVPTDVEVGRDHMLYVTTLPGGPEDGSAGANGSVYRINPRTGQTTRIATGFSGAVNLALSPFGTIYVSELYANRISRVHNGRPVPVADVGSPGGLEWSLGRLYIGADVFGPDGKILTMWAF